MTKIELGDAWYRTPLKDFINWVDEVVPREDWDFGQPADSNNKAVLYFKHEEHAILFRLRFGI